jgi:hypothetical protein
MTHQPADKPSPDRPTGEQPTATQPTEEWGERLETGRAIHRGGKDDGRVEGATSNPPRPNDPRAS